MLDSIRKFEDAIVQTLKLDVDMPGFTALTVEVGENHLILLDHLCDAINIDPVDGVAPTSLVINMCLYLDADSYEADHEEMVEIYLTDIDQSIANIKTAQTLLLAKMAA